MSATMALEGAHADEGYANIGGPKDGPVLTMMSKRLRALKKKYNRILQIEENKRQGKAINKEQENVVEQKLAVAALIDEYEKLRQPLMAAVKEEVAEREKELLAEKTTTTLELQEEEKESEPEKVVEVHENGEVEEQPVVEEVSGSEEAAEKPVVTEKESIVTEEAVFSEGEVSDLLKLLYFAHLFDVRSQGEAPSLVWTRVHERSSCLSYDFVTDDSTSPLIEADLDALSLFGSMLTSRPPNETLSHRDALQRCIEHAREWLQNSDRIIQLDAHTSYSRLKERLNRILSSEYFTMTPELQTVSQQTAAAAASAAGQYHPNKDVDHIVPPPAYYVPQEPHVPYEFGVPVPVANGAPPASTPLVFLADAPVPAFEMPQFGSHGSHEDEGVAEETTEEVEAAEQQQQQQQPTEEVVPPVNEQQQQQQPPPVQQHHGFQPRSGGYPGRGGRGGGMQGGGYQGMGGRNGGRGYVNNGGRGGRGGGRMYSNGGRGGQQFYDQQQPAGNFQPRPNHYGGGGRGGRGGRGGYPNGPPAPSPPPVATAVAPTSG